MTVTRQGAQAARVSTPALPAPPYTPGPVAFTGRAGVAGASHAAPLTVSGNAPSAPADVTTATPAPNVFGWGSNHQFFPVSFYPPWNTDLGFKGHRANIGYLYTYGGSSLFKGSTAAADSPSGVYSQQRSYEGLPSSGNGSATGLGLGKARQSGAISKAYLGCYMRHSASPATGLFGDMGDPVLRADVASKIGDLTAFINFVGMDGIAFDLEVGRWDNPTGTTQAQNLINLEQLGYEVGVEICTAMPAAEMIIYNLQFNNSWHEIVNTGLTGGVVTSSGRANSALSRAQFVFGLLRGHTAAGGTGRIRWVDHFWYRGTSQVSGVSLVTALKWNTQGTLAGLSRDLPAATWNHIAPLFDIVPFSWAGTDAPTHAQWVAAGSPASPQPDTFYTNSQEPQPTWTNNLEIYRQWGMGGWRCEYTQDGGAPNGTAQWGLWQGQNNYTFPSGRPAGMLAATSTSGSYSTTAPALTAAASGSGATRTIAGVASADRGIRRVKAYTYPGGVPVAAQMTFNPNNPPTAGIAGSTMDYTLTLTKGAATHAIVTAYSTQDQEHSTVVNL